MIEGFLFGVAAAVALWGILRWLEARGLIPGKRGADAILLALAHEATEAGAIHDRVVVLDSNLRQVGLFGDLPRDASGSSARFLGKTAAEMIGDDAARIHVEHAERALAGEVVEYDWEWDPLEGERTWWQTRATPLRDPRGRIVGVVCASHELTQVHLSNELRRKSDVAFTTIFNSSPVSMMLSSLEHGTIQLVNNWFTQLTGFRRDEVIGKTARDLKLWHDLYIHDVVGPALREERRFRNLESTIQTKSGKLKQTLAFLELIELRGKTSILRVDYDITDHKLAIEELRLSQEQYQSLMNSLVSTLAAALDARDPLTAGHTHRVTAYALGIARTMGLDVADLDRLRMAGMLHDIGKIGVPDAILLHPGVLTSKEFETMKLHATYSRNILRNLNLPPGMLALPEEAALHHERVDGSGYPDGLKGDDIPLLARILAVADCFDAITSRRVYREAMPIAQALQTMRDSSGTHLSPECVDAFFRYFEADLKPRFEAAGGSGDSATPVDAGVSVLKQASDASPIR